MMLRIYGSHHIPTSRNVTGHRACRAPMGFFPRREEPGRRLMENGALAGRRLRLAWLVEQWNKHLGRNRFV